MPPDLGDKMHTIEELFDFMKLPEIKATERKYDGKLKCSVTV